jgi:hypothetical protein
MPACGVTRDDYALGLQLLIFDEPVPAGADIVCGGGESVPGCEPVVDAEHRQVRQLRQPRRESAVGPRGAQRISAAVDEVDGGVTALPWHPGAVDPFTDEAVALRRSGVDAAHGGAGQWRAEGVHDARHDLSRTPQSPRLIGWQDGADLAQGQAADRCRTAGAQRSARRQGGLLVEHASLQHRMVTFVNVIN